MIGKSVLALLVLFGVLAKAQASDTPIVWEAKAVNSKGWGVGVANSEAAAKNDAKRLCYQYTNSRDKCVIVYTRQVLGE